MGVAYNDTWQLPSYPAFFTIPMYYYISGWTTAEYPSINESIYGRIGMSEMDASTLAMMILHANGGNHLEIGSLFGGSAILAAKVKKEFDLSGGIYCIDNLKAVGQDVITKNAETMGVELKLHKGQSDPFPFKDVTFSTALIDAGHTRQACLTDWNNIKRHVSRYVMFHDYDPAHPGVVEAASQAMQEWRPVLIYGHSLVLERP